MPVSRSTDFPGQSKCVFIARCLARFWGWSRACALPQAFADHPSYMSTRPLPCSICLPVCAAVRSGSSDPTRTTAQEGQRARLPFGTCKSRQTPPGVGNGEETPAIALLAFDPAPWPPAPEPRKPWFSRRTSVFLVRSSVTRSSRPITSQRNSHWFGRGAAIATPPSLAGKTPKGQSKG